MFVVECDFDILTQFLIGNWLKDPTNTLSFYSYYKQMVLIQLYFPSYIRIVASIKSVFFKFFIHL